MARTDVDEGDAGAEAGRAISTVRFAQNIPLVAEVDVAVAGAGIAGCTAGVAAARNSARTLPIERFAALAASRDSSAPISTSSARISMTGLAGARYRTTW